MRKLVTIRKIGKLLDIKGADFIQLAMVDDWSCIVKKGEFTVGDLAVYFEVDSLLPEEPRYEFLASSKREYFGSQKYRLKTMKMRGVISQGLALPLSMFPEITNPNTVSEGRVYKSCTVPGLSFKCISNDYLLKNED